MTAFEANNLCKSYRLKDSGQPLFHALSNISFSIGKGESVGIIGRNGAGKSTLLKLLSGITFPSSGTGKVRGTFSCLLEVGTGFHPDLTGRDNIFFNASLLGLSRRSVKSELENIISFSGIGTFMDRPLRTYSSGMKLRLAFSVIAHLKTDIIALDEVLAVGDSMFQMQCMERIFRFRDEGRTVLFVSHNMSAVKKLCERTIVLEKGTIVFDGNTDEAIHHYLETQQNSESNISLNNVGVGINECTDESASISISTTHLSSDIELDLGVNVRGSDGNELYHFSNRFIGKKLNPEHGKINVVVKFKHQLKPGTYKVSVYLGQGEQQLAWLENAAELTVPPYNPYGFHNPDALQAPMVTDFDITVL